MDQWKAWPVKGFDGSYPPHLHRFANGDELDIAIVEGIDRQPLGGDLFEFHKHLAVWGLHHIEHRQVHRDVSGWAGLQFDGHVIVLRDWSVWAVGIAHVPYDQPEPDLSHTVRHRYGWFVRAYQIGCTHTETTHRLLGNCWHEYTCTVCGYRWEVDSSG